MLNSHPYFTTSKGMNANAKKVEGARILRRAAYTFVGSLSEVARRISNFSAAFRCII
jgi:hypothetical protein